MQYSSYENMTNEEFLTEMARKENLTSLELEAMLRLEQLLQVNGGWSEGIRTKGVRGKECAA